MKTKFLSLKIFSSIFITGVLIYFVCAFLFITNLYNYFEKQIFSELETESFFIDDYAENQILQN